MEISERVAALEARMNAWETELRSVRERHHTLANDVMSVKPLTDEFCEARNDIKSLRDEVVRLRIGWAKHDVALALAASIGAGLVAALVNVVLGKA
jgi:hypothetical protein